jgi:MarR family
MLIFFPQSRNFNRATGIVMRQKIENQRDQTDRIDHLLAEWHAERPELDAAAMAVVGRLLSIGRQLEARANAVLKPLGLHYTDLDVLATLRRGGRPYRRTPTELRNFVLITSGAMTACLDRLERNALIARLDDPHDNYRWPQADRQSDRGPFQGGRGSIIGVVRRGALAARGSAEKAGSGLGERKALASKPITILKRYRDSVQAAAGTYLIGRDGTNLRLEDAATINNNLEGAVTINYNIVGGNSGGVARA